MVFRKINHFLIFIFIINFTSTFLSHYLNIYHKIPLKLHLRDLQKRSYVSQLSEFKPRI